MDKETLKKLGGTVKWIEVPYEVKLSMETSKNKWESAGASAVMHVEVGAKADPETVYRATVEWLKELVTESAGKQMKLIIQHKKDGITPSPQPPTRVHVPPKEEVEEIPFIKGKEPIQVAGEVRTPIDDAGNEVCLMNVESIEVEYTPGGEKRAKVKGKTQDYPSETWPYKGNFTKYGVVAWPEVLAEIDFDLDSRDAAKYVMQPGYVAEVQIVDGKPKKITGFR